MRFKLEADLSALRDALAAFIALGGRDRWKKRTEHLLREWHASPLRAKIVSDSHWLELELGGQYSAVEGSLTAPPSPTLDTLAALSFAQTVVAVHRDSTETGKRVLEGRIRDALKAATGFSPLYLEMDVARRLVEVGCEVEFPELVGAGQYDLRFWNGDIEGEVECKSLSADAGRKIHRRDFYRFIDAVGASVAERAAAGADEVIVVTVNDRLPAEQRQQQTLQEAVKGLLSRRNLDRIDGDFFVVVREPFGLRFGAAPSTTPTAFYEACRSAYGKSCHVSGAMTPGARCFIVVRSRREDDHSKPELSAMKKAASQLSATRPGFVAIQYDGIPPQDLVLPHLRRRAGILSYGLFGEKAANHVVATYFCVYGGLVSSDQGIGVSAFSIPNPMTTLKVRASDYPAFLANLPDEDFARLVGAAPPMESISLVRFDET